MTDSIPSLPIKAVYDSAHLTIGGGVAIFHLASSRVVVCTHSTKGYHFLPKGRRDAGESSITAAEREGYEESGYRCRVLPIAFKHRQPRPPQARLDETRKDYSFATEPILTQLSPIPGAPGVQYICFWYIAETVPSEDDTESHTTGDQYKAPTPFPLTQTISERIASDPQDYEPTRHENTGVNADERLYTSNLYSIDKAIELLGGQETIQARVVTMGWNGIRERMRLESSYMESESWYSTKPLEM